MQTVTIFLASSSELLADRDIFEIEIGRINKIWVTKGIFLKLEKWEDFLDSVSRTRLQDEYNKVILQSDIFVMLFHTKFGKYTEEEFDVAIGQFRESRRPVIFTYFKDTQPTGLPEVDSLEKFKKKLDELGHFYTRYANSEGLLLSFRKQLEKLKELGFFEIGGQQIIGGIDVFKKELIDLVDELQYDEVFLKIRDSNFVYKKIQLNSLAMRYQHGSFDMHFPGQVKTFISTIRQA